MIAVLIMGAPVALAVPSFARQTVKKAGLGEDKRTRTDGRDATRLPLCLVDKGKQSEGGAFQDRRTATNDHGSSTVIFHGTGSNTSIAAC
jgi:hypothetical protein